MRISEAIHKGTQLLIDEDSPRHIAELLLVSVLKCEKEWLLSHDETPLEADVLGFFEERLRQFAAGKPLAYITNSKEFYELDFFVDERVLIPRPETEMLVEETVKIAQNNYSKELSVLDVGTGCGNIAISLAKHLEKAKITASDLSARALDVACLNAGRLVADKNIKFVQSDLLEAFEGKSFDVIVANLPYIGTEKFNFVSKETYDNEPHMALFGGGDGLVLYKKMFQQLEELKIGFSFILGEFGFLQSDDVSVLLSKCFAHKFSIKKDGAGIDRIFIVNSNSHAG